MMEIDVYGDPNGVEIANLDQLSGASVSSGPGVDDRGNPGTVIDMVHTPGEWVNSPTGGFDDCAAGNSLYMTIDLGDYYLVTGVTVWHYYGNDRSYCNQAIATSVTGDFTGEEYVAWATGDGVQGPPESVNGNAITFPAKIARYVRHWAGRSTANGGVHFLEIDVYGINAIVSTPASNGAKEIVLKTTGLTSLTSGTSTADGACRWATCAAAPYTKWTDESSDPHHGNACFKPGGFKGGGDWSCPAGCTKVHAVPWCVVTGTMTPCRVPKYI